MGWSVLAVCVLSVAGCSDDGGPPAASSSAASVAPAQSAAPSAASSAAGKAPGFAAPKEVATGLNVPWGIAFLPGGDALVAERATGRIVQVPAQGGASKPFFQVPGVAAQGEGGLLGLAVSPGFAQDGYVYAYFTASGDNRIVRFKAGTAARVEVIFTGLAKAGIHNGGRIAFGPDGLLYVGTGDAGQSSRSQDPASPNGKILRLTADGKPAPGNPAAGSPVYSLGHRNVQGLAWDSAGRLWATEFGQNTFDEVNLIRAGANYGWPVVEGQADTQGGKFVNPLVTWATGDASPSGAAILGDTLYVAGLRGERLWTVPLNGERTGTPKAELDGKYGRLRTVVAAPDGSLWVSTSNRDGRGDPKDGDDRILRFTA